MRAPLSRVRHGGEQLSRRLRNAARLGTAFAAASLLLVGCVRWRPSAAPPIIPAGAWVKTPWLGDAQRVDLAPQSNGTIEIVVAGKNESNGKGAIVAAPLDEWTLTPTSRVRVRIESPDGETWFALAVRTDQYYESPSRVITPGGEREFVFDLHAADFKSERSRWQHNDRIRATPPLQSMELVVYPATGATRRILVHPIELPGVIAPLPAPSRSLQRLSILKTRTASARVAQYTKFEASVLVSTACSNPFDPSEITVDGLFTAPSGRKFTCPAFFFGYGSKPGLPDEWRVRFSPDEPGTWTWAIAAATPTCSVATPSHILTCTTSGNAGPIRVSKRNPLYFEHADGAFYYPIGHNVAWNSLEDYTNQFAQMAANGENWSRVWLAPWNCDIEWSPRAGAAYKGLGVYNLSAAKKLDAIFDAAERNGIAIQLVLHEHCRMSASTNPEWQNNPYNQALGGPCATPQDFLTNGTARRLARNRLRYVVARWGYSPSLLAWELFNEADLSDGFRFATDTPWHAEMAAYLKATDPHKHLVTTSYISNPNADVYRLPQIDYTQSHIYLQDLVAFFVQTDRRFAAFGKPHFIAEFGRHAADGEDAKDVEGRVLHSGLWAQFMQPDAGNAMSWWWYDHIHPHNLYGQFAALARFAKGLDRRSRSWSAQTGRFQSGNVLALAAPDELLFWIYDPQILPWTEGPAPAPRETAGDLAIGNIPDGPWRLEQWDPYRGTVVREDALTAAGNALRVPIRFAAPDAAFKLIRSGSSAGATNVPQLQLEPWDILATSRAARAAFDIPPLLRPVRIDGSDDDWNAENPSITVQPADGRSAANSSFTFRTAHDASNLFVFVNVIDDYVQRQNLLNNLWKDDSVEIWVDSRNDADFFNNMPNNPGCYQFVIAPSLSVSGLAETVTFRNPDWNDRVFPSLEAASALMPNGFSIEVRIPLERLRGTGPVKDPSHIGFNVSTCDSDPGGGTPTWNHLLWQGKDDWDARQWGLGEMR